MSARCLLALLLMAAGAPARAATPALPMISFFDNASMREAQLSPDGRHVAALVQGPQGHVNLLIIDTTTQQSRIAAAYSDSDISYAHWISDQRLVYTVTDLAKAQGETYFWPGLYAVNSDGSERAEVIPRSRQRGGARSRLSPDTELLEQWGAQDSEHVFVERDNSLIDLNTRTGEYQLVERPSGSYGWLLDRKGAPRTAYKQKDDKLRMFYRGVDDAAWRDLGQQSIYQLQSGAFQPESFGPDGQLYVQAAINGEKALFRYDPASGKPEPSPVFSTPGYDFHGEMIFDDQKVLGFSYEVDAPGTYWIDPHMQAVQKSVDAALPGTINQISVARRAKTSYVLVTSFSDVQPRVYSLFDTDSGKLRVLGRSYPQIQAAQMTPKIMARYKARDGLEIPVYVTLPKLNDGKNLPTVVLVHGGPWERGVSWEWNQESQFLASRGYVVLEPEFRGSTGYGTELFRAGWKQWGLKMQDDIADGARWAIAQGYADPKRICIAGASYGGYATLMGLIKDADLYRCGIAWAGVSDLRMLNKGHWTGKSDMGDIYRTYGFPVLIGDLDADAEQLKATSPLQQASKLKLPLLLAHGESDQRVPMVHSSLLYDALRGSNPNVEWVWYEEEGHGWRLVKNRLDFWGRVERFLDKNIGAH
jgi:dipeptidyl aminopeptidase/acylaminoacyl peptidase